MKKEGKGVVKVLKKKVKKEERPIFLKVFSIILITLVTESIAIFYASSQGFPIPKKLLLVQVPLILFMLGLAYVKNRNIWKRKVEEYGINLRDISKSSKTDLDALYTILKNKKEISVRSIANLFKIEEDLSMEWARILEAGDLATIEYPGFGSPKIIYIEKEKKLTMLKKSDKNVMKKPVKDIPSKKVSHKIIPVKKVLSKSVIRKTIHKGKVIPKKIVGKIVPKGKAISKIAISKKLVTKNSSNLKISKDSKKATIKLKKK